MKPDNSEKTIRFGCGFVFGLIIGFFTAIKIFIDSLSFIAIFAIIIALIFGLLAKRYGDDFWYSLKNWWF